MHAVQDGAMEKQNAAFSTLRIARYFEAIDGQIADPSEHCGRLPSMKCFGDPIEDELVGRADVCEGGMQSKREHQRIGQASRSLQNRSSATHPPEEWDAVSFAYISMDVFAQAAGAPQHNEVPVALPKTKDGLTTIVFQLVQKNLVERKVLGWRRKGQIKEPERTQVISSWGFRNVWAIHAHLIHPGSHAIHARHRPLRDYSSLNW